MDGGNGGWGVGCSLSNTQIGMHAEEDQFTDSERAHIDETFAFVAFAEDVSYSSGGSAGYQTSGSLISSAFNMSDQSPVQVIEWDETTNSCSPTCNVRFQIQTAPNNGGVPGTWTSTWSGPDGDDGDEDDWFDTPTGEQIPVAFNNDQWVRYRVELSGDGNETPILNEVRVNYK